MQTEHGKVLLPIARAEISRVLGVPEAADESAPWLVEHGACFVTLTQDGELRGCIGTLQAHRSLLTDVKSNAVSAALHDPRFIPLSVEELDITTVEISLLSPTTVMEVRDEADALAQIRPGVDGIVFEYGSYRSTFLPQVWEHFQQPREFLAMLKRKAGLPDDFWADEIKLARYGVTKWREADLAKH
ncbi:MAG TPA: AmmeMemoRadiSam system protein A [Gallionella sp.]|jgi:AmmeMemoRadiSam system protein A|nr:AmmeMemoRadiSam system protein A [Gallionella sp.]